MSIYHLHNKIQTQYALLIIFYITFFRYNDSFLRITRIYANPYTERPDTPI